MRIGERLLTALLKSVRRGWRRDRAAAATEYAILLALIAIVVIAAVRVLGSDLRIAYQSVSVRVTGTPASAGDAGGGQSGGPAADPGPDNAGGGPAGNGNGTGYGNGNGSGKGRGAGNGNGNGGCKGQRC